MPARDSRGRFVKGSGGSALKGADDLLVKLKALGPNLLREGGRALYAEALEIQKASMRRTPVDTGALRASHVTSEPKLEGGAVAVKIEVGGPSAEYAFYVHEDLEARHPVGEAKFLEKSVYEAMPGLGDRIARRIDVARAARG